MLGAIIGDIVGSRFEFNPTNDYDFKLFTEECDFTDDTICTVAIADALLNNADYGMSLHEWCRKYPNPKGGYGSRFREWVMSDDPKPYNSFGNGSAMRVSPIAWYYRDAGIMITETEEATKCTHNHPEGIKGAKAVGLAIHYGDEIRRLSEKIDRESILKGLERVLEYTGYDINIQRSKVLNKFDVTCQGTVPVALWIISESNGFEDAIRKAVSLGADADTLGAIVGSIAEAIWGVPTDLVLHAMRYLPSEMKSVVLRFYMSYAREIFPLEGYGDEGAARELLAAEEEEERYEKKAQMREQVIEKADSWYTGTQGKVCEGCIYKDGIRRTSGSRSGEIMGCGRCCRGTFKTNYEAGKCKFRKTDLFTPSEFELERKEIALQKLKAEEERKKARKDEFEREARALVPFKKTYVAGTHLLNDKKPLHNLEEYSKLQLVRECDNQYDEDAVSLYFEGIHIGYVPRKENHEIAAMLEAGMHNQLVTYITDVMAQHGKVSFNISVYLKPVWA